MSTLFDRFGRDIEREPLAILSECGLYRYTLRRGARCHGGAGICNFIMLNPSTADAIRDDPTIRRCVNYARDWDHDDLVVTNLFAFRATDPQALKTVADPIGPENDRHLIEQARRAQLVVCAWGDGGILHGRAGAVLRMLAGAGVRPHALKLTSVRRQPAHPLYLPGDLEPKALVLGRPTP